MKISGKDAEGRCRFPDILLEILNNKSSCVLDLPQHNYSHLNTCRTINNMIDMRVKEGQIRESSFLTMFMKDSSQDFWDNLYKSGHFLLRRSSLRSSVSNHMVAAEAAAGSILIPRIWTRIPNRYPLQQYRLLKGLVGNICHPLQCTNLLLIFTCIILTANSYFMPILTNIKGFLSV